MTALLENFSLTLPLWVFIVAGLYLALGTYSLSRLIVRTLRISTSDIPARGFLNKPLLQFMAVFAISASVAGVLYLDSTSKDTGVISEAEKQVEIEISYEIIQADHTNSQIVFSAIPTVEGKRWGEVTDQFDIVWTVQEIRGKAQNFVEQARSSTTPSSITMTLENGDYRVTALISDEESTYSETVEVEI